jgi:hypothetical protein
MFLVAERDRVQLSSQTTGQEWVYKIKNDIVGQRESLAWNIDIFFRFFILQLLVSSLLVLSFRLIWVLMCFILV